MSDRSRSQFSFVQSSFVFSMTTILSSCLLSFHLVCAEEIVFKRQWIEIGGTSIEVEIADSPEKWARGLMFRDKLSNAEGMLFVFKETKIQRFWMKNTKIPLSIGFFDDQRKLMELVDMDPGFGKSDEKLRVYSSKRPAKFALEVNRGWFLAKQIDVGRIFNWTLGSGRTKD